MELSFKEKYGQVDTPKDLVTKMLDMLPDNFYTDEGKKWLDPGCGTGIFAENIVNRLELGLQKSRSEVIEKNIYMVEYNSYHIAGLKEKFGETMNFTEQDYLIYNPSCKFDVIIGNPPYNQNHLKNIPQRRESVIQTDELKWVAIWQAFIRKSLELLKQNGYLCFIVPANWLKPDKERIYESILQYKLHKLECYSSYEVYKMFDKKAQIPCTIFLLQKTPTDNIIPIYDELNKSYIDYHLFSPTCPIPMKHISMITKLLHYTKKYGSIANYIIQTPIPSRKLKFSDEYSFEYPYINIYSCCLKENKPNYSYKWSDKPGPFYYPGLPKIILAHSVHGIPLMDSDGSFGICNRNKYIILGKESLLEILYKYLSCKFIMYLYNATQYRMRFLEKYIFELIPDISRIPGFNIDNITDEYLCNFFQYNAYERNIIEEYII